MIAEQLKKSILQAAIQGKLTEQLPEDGDARDLLKEIQKEKARLIKEGKIKKEKPLPEIAEDEIPFEIPDNWCWVRLGEVFTLQAGKFISSDRLRTEGKYPCYGGNGLRGYVDTFNRLGRFPLIGRQGALCGNINIADGAFYATEHAVVVQGYCNYVVDWAAFVLKALNLNQYATATAQPGLAVNKINQVVFPFPPLKEQQRIVERLEQILPEIDTLSQYETKLDALQKAFPKKMKDSLLQYAIQGKLTEQIPEDGDARDLLKEIEKEKARLIKEGKIKKEKPLPEITEDEIPFEIPDNWCWVRLGAVGIWAAGATPNRSEIQYYQNGTIPWLKTGDLNDNIVRETSECITELALENTSVKLQPKGTILIAMYGATIGKIGMLSIDATTNQACCGCNTFSGVYNRYLFYFLMSHKKEFINQGAGGAQPNISREKIVTNLIPLPPLAEQQRIVERLDELLPLCETLE